MQQQTLAERAAHRLLMIHSEYTTLWNGLQVPTENLLSQKAALLSSAPSTSISQPKSISSPPPSLRYKRQLTPHH